MNNRCFFFLFFLAFTAIAFILQQRLYVGKKKGYFKIDFPEKKYQSFDQPGYPYTFEYPVYCQCYKGHYFF